MSYLSATLLNDLQALRASNEKRYRTFGQLDMVKASTPSVDYVPPSVKEKLMTLPGNMLANIPVLKDQTVTVVTTPGFNQIPTNLGETANYYFSAYDVFSGFRFWPASFESNQIDAEFYRTQILMNVLEGCGATIEGIINTLLSTRKTQLLSYTDQISQLDGTFTFNSDTDILEVSKAAVKETMFYNLVELMTANKLGGNYNICTSPAGLAATDARYAQYGPNNDRNLSWDNPFMPEGRRFKSDSLAPGEDIFTGWLMRDGAMGIFENFPWDFRSETEFAGKEWSISDMELPFTKMRANVYVNTEATEATSLVESSDSNLIMTHFEEMALWFRFYVVYRYNSDLTTREQDIVKIVGKSV